MSDTRPDPRDNYCVACGKSPLEVPFGRIEVDRMSKRRVCNECWARVVPRSYGHLNSPPECPEQ